MTQRPGREAAREARGKYAPVRMDEGEILRRGLDAFAELGYAATIMRELAGRLDVSHNFINDRYGSKGNFWRARAVVDFALREAPAWFDRPGRRPATTRTSCAGRWSGSTGWPRTPRR